jgi:hypothetical protein
VTFLTVILGYHLRRAAILAVSARHRARRVVSALQRRNTSLAEEEIP